MTSTASSGLSAYVRDLEALTSAHLSLPALVEAVGTRTRGLLAEPGWLAEEFRTPRDENYARYLLHRDPKNRFVVLSLVWRPGQATPIHDHSCWGIMGMVQGTLEVVNYDRLDDGTVPNRARLREADTLHVQELDTGAVLPPWNEIHLIGNRSRETAISLHVYGRDLDVFNVYDAVTGHVSPMRIKYYNVDRCVPDYVI